MGTKYYDLTYLAPSQEQPEVPINADLDAIDQALFDGGGSISVKQVGDSPEGDAFKVREMHFSGAGVTVTPQTNGVALIEITGGTSSDTESDHSSDTGGSPLSVHFGGTTVDNVTEIIFTGSAVTSLTDEGGGVVSLELSADITSDNGGGGGGEAVPTALDLPSLQYWFDASQLTGSSGNYVPVLPNSNPLLADMFPVWASVGIGTISGTQLNGKNVVTIGGGGGGTIGYQFPNLWAPILHNSTVFAVFKATDVTSVQSIVGGISDAYSLQIGSSGINISKAFVSASASSSATLTAGAWSQVNATFDDSTGAYAFRIAESAEGSGSYAVTMSSISSGIAFTVGYGQSFQGDLAEVIVFDDVLSSGEITAVEAYLNAKWGV